MQIASYINNSLEINKSQRIAKPTIKRATSEDSDQPVHMRCLISVFVDRTFLLQALDYPNIFSYPFLWMHE